MKGIYLNVPGAAGAIARMDALWGLATPTASTRHPAFADVLVAYHPEAWPEGPLVEGPDLFAVGSGWISFRGRVGDLRGFARAFAEARRGGDSGTRVLEELDAGAYVILLGLGDEAVIVTDPFGLHPHYAADGPFTRIAPSPFFLKDGRARVPEHAAILRAKNHLFGNLTAYEGIERLEPGAVLTRGRVSPWFRYESACGDVRTLRERLAADLRRFDGFPKILPLSGGLDSRLIALSGSFDYAYTFGPRDTGDRPVARRFANRFREYKEFSLLEVPYPRHLREAALAAFDGTCERPFLEIAAVYKYLHERWGSGFFFDGYLGDVLQRGTYLTHGGIRGSLAKLVPGMTLRGFDPVALLRRRHAALGPREFSIVADLYEEKMSGMDLDGPHKVLLFEILHGRGARHTTNGGTILSGQFWTPVQPFFFPSVFRLLFGQRLEDALYYRTVRRVWSGVEREHADVATYSGFKPLWNEHRARATMLAVKGLGKTGLVRRSISYESELPRVRWT